MKHYFEHYIVSALYRHKNYYEFLKDHDAEVNWHYEEINGIPLNFMLQIVKEIGYNIEVSEVSAAGKAEGSISGRNWHRLNKYRYNIVYWDEFGTMVSLTYSDDNKFFDSEDDAHRNAIDFIMENYKQLENS